MTKISREFLVENIRKGLGFDGADLRGLDLRGADLSRGVFTAANFRYTDLRDAVLEGADLRRANLRHVVLTGSRLSGADLREADLTHADLRGANLVGARLEGAKIEGARGVSEKVFFTQKMLDSLNEQKKIELEGEVLTILTGNKPSFSLTPAYRFIMVEGGGEDINHVLGKVKTEDELGTLHAEVYRDSAIIGELAYRVEPGYIGIPVRGTAQAQASPRAGKEAAKKSDEDMLAEFFLKNL